MEKTSEVHNIPPLYDKNSRVLILGSFPSVKSRKAAFFYAHPQNRFWRGNAKDGRRKTLACPAPWRRPVGYHRFV